MAEQNNAEQNNTVQTAEEQKKVYSRQQERRELDNYRQTKIERIDRLRYRAYGANGATLDFGVGEGLLTPVEPRGRSLRRRSCRMRGDYEKDQALAGR